jgi:hypothetical protein
MDRPIDPVEDKFWAYVRGELDEPAFEAWVYAAPDLEIVLGPEDYLSVAACDFSDASRRARYERVEKVRDIVARRFPRSCVCLSVARSGWHGMNGPKCLVATHAETLARRTPWIDLLQCRDCGTFWLVGTDTVDDAYYVQRLSTEAAADIVAHDHWPTDMDTRANLWPDVKWLKAFGYDSLDAWRAAHDPSRRPRPR